MTCRLLEWKVAGHAAALSTQHSALYYSDTSRDNAPLSLQLVSERTLQIRQAIAASLLLVIVLFLAWTITYFPRILSWLRILWPEQMVLLGFLAQIAFGLSVMALVLVFLGLGVRFVHLVYWSIVLVRRHGPARPQPDG